MYPLSLISILLCGLSPVKARLPRLIDMNGMFCNPRWCLTYVACAIADSLVSPPLALLLSIEWGYLESFGFAVVPVNRDPKLVALVVLSSAVLCELQCVIASRLPGEMVSLSP